MKRTKLKMILSLKIKKVTDIKLKTDRVRKLNDWNYQVKNVTVRNDSNCTSEFCEKINF